GGRNIFFPEVFSFAVFYAKLSKIQENQTGSGSGKYGYKTKVHGLADRRRAGADRLRDGRDAVRDADEHI
ncbi:MAG: hypothetical protein LBT12_06160, partial [Oscillospiraceae bacterium]|nr:hypothetical protein [Oscillospiraceae bacterium]